MRHDATAPREVPGPEPGDQNPQSSVVAIGIAVLLLLPIFAAVAVPLYARENPRLAGVPFFYWYQFACVLLTAGCLAAALRLRRGRQEAP